MHDKFVLKLQTAGFLKVHSLPSLPCFCSVSQCKQTATVTRQSSVRSWGACVCTSSLPLVSAWLLDASRTTPQPYQTLQDGVALHHQPLLFWSRLPQAPAAATPPVLLVGGGADRPLLAHPHRSSSEPLPDGGEHHHDHAAWPALLCRCRRLCAPAEHAHHRYSQPHHPLSPIAACVTPSFTIPFCALLVVSLTIGHVGCTSTDWLTAVHMSAEVYATPAGSCMYAFTGLTLFALLS